MSIGSLTNDLHGAQSDFPQYQQELLASIAQRNESADGFEDARSRLLKATGKDTAPPAVDTDSPDQSVAATLAERGKRYGDFSIHASIAQRLQDDMRSGKGWHMLTDDKRQALTVIADKIARILSGDPEYKDNWHDIQGYAKLCEDRCTS